MAIRAGSSLGWIFPAALAVFLSVAPAPISVPQERKNPQTAGVDNTKMGLYRALAHDKALCVKAADHAYLEKLKQAD